LTTSATAKAPKPIGVRKIWTALAFLALLVVSLFYLMPVYVMLVTGLKPFKEVSLTTMWDLPRSLSFDNFTAAWRALRPNMMNSVVLAIPAATISSVLGSMNGYVLSKWKFKGSNTLFAFMLFGMFIPYQAILIPLVQFLMRIGLYGSMWGLILVHVVYGLPITTLIFRNYYASVPNEILESAAMDGAGFFDSFLRVILPLSPPSFAVVLIWQFTSIWNEFLFAVILTGNKNWPVTVALNNLAGSQIVEWNVQMAGALIAAFPTILVYLLLGKYFMRGLMAGALKG